MTTARALLALKTPDAVGLAPHSSPLAAPAVVEPLLALRRQLSAAPAWPALRVARDDADLLRRLLGTREAGLEAQNLAAALRIRAERAIGQWLRDTTRNPGGLPEHHDYPATNSTGRPPTLAELGIA